MQKAKKMSKQTLVIAVLAVLLVLSLALSVTGAWFTDTDSATSATTINFGKVDVTASGEDATVTRDDGRTTADKLLPGDIFHFTATVNNGDSDVEIYIGIKVENPKILISGSQTDIYTHMHTKGYISFTPLAASTTEGYTAVTAAESTKGLTIYKVAVNAGDLDLVGSMNISEDLPNMDETYRYNLGADKKVGTETDVAGLEVSATIAVYAIQAANIDSDSAAVALLDGLVA